MIRCLRRGQSLVKNTAVVGSVSFQPCCRMAWKNRWRAADSALVGARPARLVRQPGQVALQQRPVDASQPLNVQDDGREERAEPGERLDVAESCPDVE